MKVFRIAFVAAALCAMTAPASSDELYGTLKKVRDTKTFTIGFREASFPFAYYDDEKKPVGFSVELCNRIADALKQQLNLPDLAVRYLPINAQTRIPLLTNGTIDIECGSTTNNSARGKQVQFATNYFYTGTKFLVKTGTTVPYAIRRINEHILQFTRLYDDLNAAKVSEPFLNDLESRNNVFPHLDYRIYAS